MKKETNFDKTCSKLLGTAALILSNSCLATNHLLTAVLHLTFINLILTVSIKIHRGRVTQNLFDTS